MGETGHLGKHRGDRDAHAFGDPKQRAKTRAAVVAVLEARHHVGRDAGGAGDGLLRHASLFTELAQGALDAAIRYTTERQQFGKAIAEFQSVQFQLARAATDVEAARLMVYNAARLRDAGVPFLKEAAMCKIFSSEVAERVSSLAVNLFGGYGFVKDYPVEKFFRDAKIGQIYEGTSNLQLQTIAKQIL